MRRVVRAFGTATLIGLAAVRADGQEKRAAPAGSTLDGVYTAEQAARGKDVYVRVCSACHALDWYQGDVMRAWEGAPLLGFFELVRTSMPQSNPGSLKRREYVDMVAYILELNGMPAGQDALSSRASVLRNILFEWRDD